MKTSRERWRCIATNGWFVWFAWAAVAHGGLFMKVFVGITIAMLFIEVLLFGMAFYGGFGQKMADNLLKVLPVPLWCELAFDVAFAAWLVWLGHGWLTVASYAATSCISGGILVSAWARSVEAKTWGGEK